MAEILPRRRKPYPINQSILQIYTWCSLLINKAFSNGTLTNKQLKYKFILHERESKSPSMSECLHLMCRTALLYCAIFLFCYCNGVISYNYIMHCNIGMLYTELLQCFNVTLHWFFLIHSILFSLL